MKTSHNTAKIAQHTETSRNAMKLAQHNGKQVTTQWKQAATQQISTHTRNSIITQ